jgi:hypothetical protein
VNAFILVSAAWLVSYFRLFQSARDASRDLHGANSSTHENGNPFARQDNYPRRAGFAKGEEGACLG